MEKEGILIKIEIVRGGIEMKRIVSLALAAVMTFGGAADVFAAESITVTVNGERVAFADQQPVNIGGYVMVPIRDVAEKMGWETEWFIYYGDMTAEGTFRELHDVVLRKSIVENENYMAGYQTNICLETQTRKQSISGVEDSKEVDVLVPAKVVNGHTLFGIRDIAESMYADVHWDRVTKTVAVTTKEPEELPHYEAVKAYISQKNEQAQQFAEEQNLTTKTVKKAEKEQEKTEETVRRSFSEEIVSLVNAERETAGLHSLKTNSDLTKAAEIRAREIVTEFSHIRPNGEKSKTAAREIGFAGDYVGENIAAMLPAPEAVVEAWMDSDGHRRNILKEEYTDTGVGYLYDESGAYKHYWVQIFGK